MNDLELKEQLLATCPVLPGQEGRAWLALREKLAAPASPVGFSWLSLRFSKTVAYGALASVFALVVFNLGVEMRPLHHGVAFADSQVPGVYATSFYSHSAQAQVVWLNGMDPATDRPTYLDPTSAIKNTADGSAKNADRL